jgi:hypothetical protein
MQVTISATALSDTFQITENHRFIYKACIESIYNQLSISFNLTNLSQVVIPEDYEKELLSFQRKNGKREFITKNDFGLGYAQVVSFKKNEKMNYVIFLRKDLLSALLPDEQMETFQKSLSEENYAEALKARNLAINTIIHEFAHVDEMNDRELIGWIDTIKADGSLVSFLSDISLAVWAEYYACRKSNLICQIEDYLLEEIIETCKQIDIMIQEQREQYHRSKVSLDEFVSYFHSYTSFVLKKMASYHGHLFAMSYDYRIETIQNISALLIDQPAYLIWSELGAELELLFKRFPEWESEESLNNMINILRQYYNRYEVYLSDTELGIYYNIPVKFINFDEDSDIPDDMYSHK